LSWWRAETNAFDHFGVNNGTLAGNTTYATGWVGQAFSFDGNGDAVRVGSPTNLQLQDFTIEAWIKRSSTSISSQVTPDASFFGYGHAGYGFGMWSDGSLFLTKWDTDNVTTTPVVTDTNFHHVAVTKSGTAVTFYVDGVSVAVLSYDTIFIFSTTAAIGAQGDNLNCSFYGLIDELSIYNRALADFEIQGIYNAGNAGKCASPVGPSIVSQPMSQTVFAGANVSFSVTANGTPPLFYQWLRNTTNLPGATSSSLNLTNVQIADGGTYAVIVSNSVGPVTSSDAVLTVNPPPPCSPPPTGLVSWWPGENNTNDVAGGNSGVLLGGAGYTNGVVGRAFRFDGTSGHLRVADRPSLHFTNGLTIET